MGVRNSNDPSRRSEVVRRRSAEAVAENRHVVLAEARSAAPQLPWRAAEHARCPRHPHHLRGGMIVLDNKSSRLVLRVLGEGNVFQDSFPRSFFLLPARRFRIVIICSL